jgi:hypothetical protein
VGVKISTGQIGRWLSQGHEVFHEEEAETYRVSLAVCPWQHIDETGTRVGGDNRHCHILTNPLVSHYHTPPAKSRQAVLEVVQNRCEGHFLLNEQSIALLEQWQLPETSLWRLEMGFPRQTQDRTFTHAWLDEHLPHLNPQQRQRVLDGLGIAAYHAQTDLPVVKLFIADDAAQFRYVTAELALCWVHEGRHYKKLNPTLSYHRQLQHKFLRSFWRFYGRLKRYRDQPSPQLAARLSHQFDRLFAIRTGYEALDTLIARTQAHKHALLMVLRHPEIPLHNNAAELGARRRVCKRRVSYGPNSESGLQAWDTFMSLAGTTQLLGISFFHYLRDRLMHTGDIPPLPDLIRQHAMTLNLAQSWTLDSAPIY